MEKTTILPQRLEKSRSGRRARLAQHAPGQTASLPASLLLKLRPRLGRVALLYALAHSLAFVMYESVNFLFMRHPLHDHTGHLLDAAAILFALLVFALARYANWPAERFLLPALAFEVLASLAIGMSSYAYPLPEDTVVWGISWICVWITIYPLVVPLPPGRAAVAAFLAALMGPLAHVFWMWQLDYRLPATTLAVMWLPNFISAAVGWVAARLVFGMEMALSRAREMGSYRLVEPLGQGGMGEVWRAEHRMLARPAAVKLIRPEVLGRSDDPELDVRRFEREARATAALQSPHTVRLFDYGVTEDGTFYYVMELLDGLDLETLVDRFGPLPPERVTCLLSQACASLAEAHARGLIHRDVKPANLYACRLGLEVDYVKVLDFGLVKPHDAADDGWTRLTAGVAMAGTPYMAPEMARGKPLDGRADLYALGCVAYWLLTGKLVFDGTSPLETISHHLKTPPDPPSRHAPDHVPEELDRLVLQCLEKEPARRPADAEALARALDTVPLTALWTEARARAWWDEHLHAAAVPPGDGASTMALSSGLPSPTRSP